MHLVSTIHARIIDEQIATAGFGERLIRVAVGLEEPQNIVQVLVRGLRPG